MTYSVQESHGIMFHHFHDSRHVKGQGSISQETFVKILDHVGSERLLPAQDWLGLALKGALDNQVCLTFDDALRCPKAGVPAVRTWHAGCKGSP